MQKTRKLELKKRTLKGVKKADMSRIVGGAISTGPKKPPMSHTCATCTTSCKTMIICSCT